MKQFSNGDLIKVNNRDMTARVERVDEYHKILHIKILRPSSHMGCVTHALFDQCKVIKSKKSTIII